VGLCNRCPRRINTSSSESYRRSRQLSYILHLTPKLVLDTFRGRPAILILNGGFKGGLQDTSKWTSQTSEEVGATGTCSQNLYHCSLHLFAATCGRRVEPVPVDRRACVSSEEQFFILAFPQVSPGPKGNGLPSCRYARVMVMNLT
jgi:hypothetical protein